MRIGYSYWGFLGDNKLDDRGNELSTPDGNATYSWSIIHEAQSRGWDVYAMQEDRDWPAFQKYGRYNFSAFSERKRTNAYLRMLQTYGENLPELDVLLVEWRFPIGGRNCVTWEGHVCEFPSDMMYNGEKLQPDLKRQVELLKHYKSKGTKIILWDLDHKLTQYEELLWSPDAIFETSHTPLKLSMERTRVEPPTIVSDLLEHPTLPLNASRKMVYIGSRYERDDIIQKYLEPVSRIWPNQIEFWGNWTREPNLSECKAMWPHFNYNGRITTKDFRRVYGDAVSCPLLAKKSYLETGFITPRPWEALGFGTIPVGIASARGIDNYVLFKANDADEFVESVSFLSKVSVQERDKIRRENIEKLFFMDASRFVDQIEKVLNG